MTAPSADVLKNMIDNLSEQLKLHIDASAKMHQSTFNLVKESDINTSALIKEIQIELRESNGWKNKFIGALGVIFIVVVPLMSWALYQIVNIDARIKEQLAETLEENFDITPYDENNK